MQRAEDVAFKGDVYPLVAIFALEVLLVTWKPLAVDDEKAEADDDDRDGAEDEVAEEETLRLLLEELFIIAEPVGSGHWELLPVDHVVVVLEHEIVDLVCQNEQDKKDEVRGVDATVAVVHDEDGDEQQKSDQMHERTVVPVEPLEEVRALVVSLRDARVNHQAERHEVRPLTEKEEQEDAKEVHVRELVHPQVNYQHCLEQPEALQLRPAADQTIVPDHTLHHVEDHH